MTMSPSQATLCDATLGREMTFTVSFPVDLTVYGLLELRLARTLKLIL